MADYQDVMRAEREAEREHRAGHREVRLRDDDRPVRLAARAVLDLAPRSA